jgi:CP family cyanate transporter-like MFS transporter
VNATYFATNFFLPRYLHETGRESDIGVALTALNVGQIPASILLLFVAGGLEQRAWPYIGCGVLCLASVLSIVFGNSLMVIGGAALLGFAAATVLILMLALPPLLSPPEDVHRTAAAMFTIGYSCAVIVPVFSGIGWVLSGIPAMAFVPIGLCAFMLIVPAATVRIRPNR